MTATIAPPPQELSRGKTYSIEEYRQREETAEQRHEYHAGEIIPMTGGTLNHTRIIRNLMVLLHLALQGTPFEVCGSELRIWLPAHQRGLYPDLSIFEGEPVLTENRRDEVLNPCAVVEVLSPSTEAYDRGQKFRFYRTIPSLQDYLLISQLEPVIEHYHRTENDRWILATYAGLETAIPLPIGNIEINSAQVYQGVTFDVQF